MKKLFCFLAVASTALFTSCSDDDSGDNNTNPNPPVTEVTAITVSSNHSSIELGNAVTFTTKDQAGNTLTQGVTYTVADAAISNPWTPTTAGTFTVVAKYAELTAQVNVTVTEEVVIEPTPNSIQYNGEESVVTKTAFVLWGGIDPENPDSEEVTHAYWSLINIDGNDIAAALSDPTTVSTYMDVEFFTALTAEGQIVLPSTDNIVFGDIYALIFNGEQVEFETSTDGSLNFAAPFAEGNTSIAFDLNAMLDSNELSLSYEGLFDDIYQPQAGRPAAGTVNGRAAKANRKPLQIIVLK